MSIIAGSLESIKLKEECKESDETMYPSREDDSETETIANSETFTEDPVLDDLRMHMEAWKESAKERPLRVLVCGLGGVGKSTLVNRLLQLKNNEKWAEEGRRGGATTSVVSKHEKTTERGIKVCLFDTPGFDDVDMSNEEIIAMMESKTEKKLDMVFYCISLDGPARVQRADVQAIKIMTQAFSNAIWKKTVIVLTFANALEKKVEDGVEYEATITQIRQKVQQLLRKDAHVSEDIVTQVPIVTAGHTEMILKYEAEECQSVRGWDNRLFLKALEQVDPEVLPTLFEVRFSWKDLGAALGGGGGGAAMGTGVGAGVGAVIGAPLGPISAAVGAAVGAGIGAGVGAAGGAGVGMFVFQLVKIKSILKIKYKKWQMKKRPPTTIPRQVSDSGLT